MEVDIENVKTEEQTCWSSTLADFLELFAEVYDDFNPLRVRLKVLDPEVVAGAKRAATPYGFG